MTSAHRDFFYYCVLLTYEFLVDKYLWKNTCNVQNTRFELIIARQQSLTRDTDIAILPVCLSVCLSVTLRYQMKTD